MTNTVDTDKRRFLTNATTVVGSLGAIVVAIPFISSMSPSAEAQAAGAPVEVDISKLETGQLLTIEWRGKPVWIFRRSEETLATLANLTAELRDPHSEELAQQPDCCKNDSRSIREDLMVLVGICTHLGCAPTYRPELAPEDLGADWQGGFFCPCHGSKFDLAGRVYQSVPAPTNLVVPPYYFINDHQLLIGKEQIGAA
jgi:ubiquinol-cytochrome c reductase iron-sulfur subunit